MEQLLSVWVIEFFKLLGRRRLHPLTTHVPSASRWFASTLIKQAADMRSRTRAHYTRGLDFLRTTLPR